MKSIHTSQRPRDTIVTSKQRRYVVWRYDCVIASYAHRDITLHSNGCLEAVVYWSSVLIKVLLQVSMALTGVLPQGLLSLDSLPCHGWNMFDKNFLAKSVVFSWSPNSRVYPPPPWKSPKSVLTVFRNLLLSMNIWDKIGKNHVHRMTIVISPLITWNRQKMRNG